MKNQIPNPQDVIYTVGKSETESQEKELTLEEQNQMLLNGLADSTQQLAIVQNEKAQLIIKHENEMLNMVKAGDNDAPKFMKAIVEAMNFMDQRQDYKAYQTLEFMKKEFGENYGFKTFDPLDPNMVF